MKKLFVLLVSLMCLSAFAQDDWKRIGIDFNGDEVSIKGGSGKTIIASDRVVAYYATFKHKDRKGKVQLRKKFVRTVDCYHGTGMMATTTMTGDVIFEVEYRLGRKETVEDIAGFILCHGIFYHNNNERFKT